MDCKKRLQHKTSYHSNIYKFKGRVTLIRHLVLTSSVVGFTTQTLKLSVYSKSIDKQTVVINFFTLVSIVWRNVILDSMSI